ncbi:MAG: putative bifunctional diguanylate cyclase/phosphodiesterase [Solirubrobacteraceae bacterium]
MDSRILAVYSGMAILLLAYIVSVVVRRDGEIWPAIDYWGVAAFEIVASLLCIGRGALARDARDRRLPVLLGLGLLAWSLGDVVVAAYNGAPPSPGLSDLFYIAFYPLTYVALMLLMRRQVRRFSVETWLDGAIAGLGAAALCAAFVFQGVLRAAGGSTAAVATNLVYPVGDLMLLILVVGGSAVLPTRRRVPWLMLSVGYALNAVGDTFNLFASGVGATHVGTLFNAVAWPTSILLISASVWIRSKPTAPLARIAPPGFGLPGVAAVCALVVVFASSATHVGITALFLAGLTLAAAGVRFAFSLSNLRVLTEERRQQAITDQLTALANRRALFDLLDALAEERAGGTDEPRSLAFLFMDLDRFKEVNDSFGHSVGDELLRQLGQRLKSAIRASDLLVRLGGDEFAVVLLDADIDYGSLVAQRLSSRLEEPFQLGSVRARISASIGIAVSPHDAEDAPELLRCADLAMYRAKTEEKPFAIYSHELDELGNRIALVEDLRLAIENRELELCYQPQINIDSGEVVALEALARWNHPRLGPIPPLEFLPLAEDAGLMDQLTVLVLDMALAQCARWRDEDRPVAVSVNISSTNLVNPDFPSIVDAALTTHRVPAETLVLEITETTAITAFNRCKQTIADLKQRGITVSVDDFGAGFTSLAYLSSLAVSELKLDRSFVTGLANSADQRNMALVRSTISLAHALGLRVVAEGVEDEASLDLLGGFDCDLAQGYLISKPKPATELELGRFGLRSADWPASSERPALSREAKTGPSHSRGILPTDAPRFGDAVA